MTTQPEKSEEIKRLVRNRYGSRARGVIELTVVQEPSSGDAGCCGPDDMERAMRIYQEGQLCGVPAESVAASAGCGNPTALAGLKPAPTTPIAAKFVVLAGLSEAISLRLLLCSITKSISIRKQLIFKSSCFG